MNFFQNYYSVMDYEKKQIGLAKSKNFLKGESKSFVHWAFNTRETLMNLVKYLTHPIESVKNTDTTTFLTGLAVVGTVAAFATCAI